MNTNQTITVQTGQNNNGITFSAQLYGKVSVIIQEKAPTPGRVGKAVLLWSGNNTDFTGTVAPSVFTGSTGADGSTSLGIWWTSGDTGVMSSFMKVQIYNSDLEGTQDPTNSVADSATLSTITHPAFSPPLQVGEGITIINHTGALGDTRMNGAYSVATVTDDTHTIITKTAGDLLPATTFTTTSAAVASATQVTFTGTGSRTLVVGESIPVTLWPAYTELNQTYIVSAASSTTFSATTATGLLMGTTFTPVFNSIISTTDLALTHTAPSPRTPLVVGEEVTIANYIIGFLNQTYTVKTITSATQIVLEGTGLSLINLTASFIEADSTTDATLTHATHTFSVGQLVSIAGPSGSFFNQVYTVKTLDSPTSTVLEGTGLTPGGNTSFLVARIGNDISNGSAITGTISGTFTSGSAKGEISGIYNSAAGAAIAATTVTGVDHDYDISVKFK